MLADRDLTFHKQLGLHKPATCRLRILAFTKGKIQLSLIEVEGTKAIAIVRICPEGVIGMACHTI